MIGQVQWALLKVSVMFIGMALGMAVLLGGCASGSHAHPPMVCQFAQSSTGMRALVCEAIKPEQLQPGVREGA
jgi:hypothetical protein